MTDAVVSSVACGIRMKFDCRACTATVIQEYAVDAGDPVFAPQHFLPRGWFVFNGYPVCPAHDIRLQPVESARESPARRFYEGTPPEP